MKTAKDWITQLALEPHPEGGYYRRIYTADQQINGQASASAIHYLLDQHDFSAWHRIKQDELWFHHEGCHLMIRQISASGQLSEHILGKDENLTILVPANTWFCAEPLIGPNQSYALVSCVVTPEFQFNDFEMGNAEELVNIYPQHRDIICRLCRSES